MQVENLSIEEILKKIIKITANNEIEIVNAQPNHVMNQPYGYVRLDSTGKIETVELGGSGASTSRFLRGDRSWAVPAGANASESHISLVSLFAEATF